MSQLQDTDRPQTTVWPFDLVHGMLETEAGLIWGWGWVCRAHPQPEGLHGYPSEGTALVDLAMHTRECPGRG